MRQHRSHPAEGAPAPGHLACNDISQMQKGQLWAVHKELFRAISLLTKLVIFARPLIIRVLRDTWGFIELREQKGCVRRESSLSVVELLGEEVHCRQLNRIDVSGFR